MNDLFLDTGYAVALALERDQYHERAVELVDRIEQDSMQLVTTRAVIVEIGNALADPAHREKAVEHIAALGRNPTVEIVSLSEELFRRGFALYRERQDKSWGLTDCLSFVVMRERDIREALSADEDFEQAGFRALLRE